MSLNQQLKYILSDLRSGSLRSINTENTLMINNAAIELLNLSDPISLDQVSFMKDIVTISNILYNNTDRSVLPLEDGVYDLLLEKYKIYDPSYLVGAEPILFDKSYQSTEEEQEIVDVITRIDVTDKLFIDDILADTKFKIRQEDLLQPIFTRDYNTSSKMYRDTRHNYPKLVGTLDKCKFSLNSQARDRGVFDDANVKIFERDFIQKHISMGIISPTEIFTMVLELKYDGVSVEADVTNQVCSARSRGDTNMDLATDLTPVLQGYQFNRASQINEVIGMKFEAIITYDNLIKYSQAKNRPYKNCRNAIVGIFGSLDGRDYRDLITLVPLATSLDSMNRIEEIEFMNEYYSSMEPLRYAVISGTYLEILFQVKKFVEEAEYMRSFLPFMYDGVVVSYLDENKRKALGRENSVNKFSVAIKFNALKRQTTFIGYTYNIGQNGTITPIIHYNPVEFYGTIHTKSSGHSYDRFKKLGLRIGDIINVEYTNDVMPYVTKPDIEANKFNSNKEEEFIKICPCCGTVLSFTNSGKSVMCNNIECRERNIIRMANMLQKLNFKDFSEETIRAIGKSSLTELSSLKENDIRFLGELSSKKFIDRMTELMELPIYDYVLIGALGFSSVAMEKWKLIFEMTSLAEFISMNNSDLQAMLSAIKGIGPVTIQTIIDERHFFITDLLTILNKFNVVQSKGLDKGKVVRFTGVRDKDLIELVNKQYPSCDIGEGGITKSTDILIVPYSGHTSSKTIKALSYGTIIVPLTDFAKNLNKYLG